MKKGLLLVDVDGQPTYVSGMGLSGYIEAGMARARYETLLDGRVLGNIPGLIGPAARAASVEECREALRQELEDWMVLALATGEGLPSLATPRLKSRH